MATILNEDFNSYNDGDLNGQGSWSGSAAWDVQASVVYEGAKAIQCASTGAGINKHGTARTDGKVSYYTRNTAVNGESTTFYLMRASDGASSVRCMAPKSSTNQIWCYDNETATQVPGTFTINEWHLIEIEWHSSPSDQFRIRFDGGTWTDWLAAEFGQTWGAGGLDELRIYHNGTDTAYFDYIAEEPYSPPVETNFQINIGDSWKTVNSIQINIGDVWKAVTHAWINIGDVWKKIF